jgi:hypothetical protein
MIPTILRCCALHLTPQEKQPAMPDSQQPEHQKHPSASEHPEQRRQEETGHEDASDPSEVGRPPSESNTHKKSEHAA